jgi:hypothetical protein
MFTPVFTIDATQFQRVYVCNASQQTHLPTLHNRVLSYAVYRPSVFQTCFLKYYYPCIMFHSPQRNARDCLEPVRSVVFFKNMLLPLEGLSHMYPCGCGCLDI